MIAAPVIGHRGGAGMAPENTLAAVRAAARLGVRWVEVDVQLCADHMAVVFHDATVDRCTDGSGRIADYGAAKLGELDAGSHFDPEFTGERIPLLKDLLGCCRQLDMGVNLELKVYPGRDPKALAATVMRALVVNGANLEKTVVSSFSQVALQVCRNKSPDVRLGLVCETYPDDLPTVREELGLATVHPNWVHLNSRDLRRARALGLETYAWTVSDPRQARLLKAWGVSGIMTDFPQRFIGK